MRSLVIIAGIVLLAGCSSNRMYYSPYDLDRDGTMDAMCPGMTYDTSKRSYYGWRSKGSKACNESLSDNA